MDARGSFHGLEQSVGALLILAVLLDVFLIVLYARIGTGVLSRRLACIMWWLFRSASKPLGRWRGTALSFCGPVILLLLVGLWISGVTFGIAMVLHPKLVTAITASTGSTPTDFVTAMYVGGDSLSTVGSSDIVPRTG